MSDDLHAAIIEAALQAFYNEGAGLKYSGDEIADMRRALATAFKAEADQLEKSGLRTGQIHTWLRQRAAELDGQSYDE